VREDALGDQRLNPVKVVVRCKVSALVQDRGESGGQRLVGVAWGVE
jgi:hypothetical protein